MTIINKDTIVATYHDATLTDIVNVLTEIKKDFDASAMLVRFTLYYRGLPLIAHPLWRTIATHIENLASETILEIDKEIVQQYKAFYDQPYIDWAKENDIVLWTERSMTRIRITISHNMRGVDDTLFWIDNEVDAMAFKLTWQ